MTILMKSKAHNGLVNRSPEPQEGGRSGSDALQPSARGNCFARARRPQRRAHLTDGGIASWIAQPEKSVS